MCYIALNIYSDESIPPFNTEFLIKQINKEFPEAIVKKDDPLIITARRAEENVKTWGEKFRIIADKAWRDAEAFGPAYEVVIPDEEATEIIGQIQRYLVVFTSTKKISTALQNRLLTFLYSLRVGQVSHIPCVNK
jgi:hypothetical protein